MANHPSHIAVEESRRAEALYRPAQALAPRRRAQVDAEMLAALPEPVRSAPTLVEQLTLPALLIVAWVIFELTANATLSLLAACLHFGWEDFRTAFWLKRTDSDPGRARTCFWFYLASGVWKTSLIPIVVVLAVSVVVALLSPRAWQNNHAVAAQIWSALVVGLAAAALLVLVTTVAVCCAVLHEVRVWVHYDVHRSRRKQRWPPRWKSPVWQHENHGRAILATALVFATIGLPPLLFRFIVLFGQRTEILAALTVVFGIPMAATTAYAALRNRIFARHPWQCWPESAIDATLGDGAAD